MIKVMATIQFLRRRSCGGFCPQTGRSTSRCCVAWTAEAPKGIYDHCGPFGNFFILNFVWRPFFALLNCLGKGAWKAIFFHRSMPFFKNVLNFQLFLGQCNEMKCFFFCVFHIFQNFPCTLGEKSESVSFAFTRTYTHVHGKFWKMWKTQKKKTIHFITLSHEQLKVQYIFEERHRSMKEDCLWERCKKKSERKLTIQHFRLHIHT